MGIDSLTAVAIFIFSTVFAVIGWLLQKKDEAQEMKIRALTEQIKALSLQIDLLFKKHDEDAKALEELKLKIAEKHYIKPELDRKFEQIDLSIKEGLGELGKKFDNLAQTLLSRTH